MVKEALLLLEKLAGALERARARRTPAQTASTHALETIHGAVVATRAYVHDESLAFDGSRESARWFALTRLWKQAATEVLGLELAGAEKSLARGEGWLTQRPWKRIDKEDGGWRLETILDHAAWLLKGFSRVA